MKGSVRNCEYNVLVNDCFRDWRQVRCAAISLREVHVSFYYNSITSRTQLVTCLYFCLRERFACCCSLSMAVTVFWFKKSYS